MMLNAISTDFENAERNTLAPTLGIEKKETPQKYFRNIKERNNTVYILRTAKEKQKTLLFLPLSLTPFVQNKQIQRFFFNDNGGKQ